ncbi:beta-galactosidase [Paenibacillus lacisoli]|nr:beta-galactosidase [Paenibacillus sp. JX-17]
MIWVGVDYYPEQWDRSLWEQDAVLMKEAGVHVVRMAEFAWSRLEPQEGRYDLAWLDEAIDLFGRYEIAVVLGIPTMTPPLWLTQHYPDVLPDLPGQPSSHPGVRGHRCYNSPSMRKYTRLIAEKLAEHYKDHPAVIGWQTDNEFSLHMCRCKHCIHGFHQWLQERYETLEVVNREWGTAVWSGAYTDWSQITLYETSEQHFNPSFLLDYRRFQSESVVRYQQIQVDAIRQHNPEQFITHNTWSAPLPLEHEKLYEPLDFASFDYYPASSPDKTATNPYSGALLLDRTRGFKNRNFWVMEQFGGPPGSWMPIWRSPYPGFIRAYAWQSISRGADGVVFFRWRSAIAGAEQFWHGLIDHSNVPGRRFEEFRTFAGEVRALSEQLSDTVLVNRAAILYDFASHTALQLQPQVEGFDYYEELKVIHRSFVKLGIGIDVITDVSHLERYDLVVVPSMFVLEPGTADAIAGYVQQGGLLIATPRTGVKEGNNQCIMRPLPGPLSECLGVQVTEYDPIALDRHTFHDEDGTLYHCSLWNDLLKLTTARAVAWYSGDFYEGTPAVSVNAWGEGQAYYLATFPEEAYWHRLLAELARSLHIPVISQLPEGVQISTRQRGEAVYTFVLNLSREVKTVKLDHPYERLLGRGQASSTLELEPYGVEVLQSAPQKHIGQA